MTRLAYFTTCAVWFFVVSCNEDQSVAVPIGKPPGDQFGNLKTFLSKDMRRDGDKGVMVANIKRVVADVHPEFSQAQIKAEVDQILADRSAELEGTFEENANSIEFGPALKMQFASFFCSTGVPPLIADRAPRFIQLVRNSAVVTRGPVTVTVPFATFPNTPGIARRGPRRESRPFSVPMLTILAGVSTCCHTVLMRPRRISPDPLSIVTQIVPDCSVGERAPRLWTTVRAS